MRTNVSSIQSFALCVLTKLPWVTAAQKTAMLKPNENNRNIIWFTRPAHEMVASDEHNRIGDNGLRRISFVNARFRIFIL